MTATPAAFDSAVDEKSASSPASRNRPESRRDLHEGGLAGPVLTDERVDRPRVDGDGSGRERHDRAERLDDVAELEHGSDSGDVRRHASSFHSMKRFIQVPGTLERDQRLRQEVAPALPNRYALCIW
jgi:hypothetical protein